MRDLLIPKANSLKVTMDTQRASLGVVLNRFCTIDGFFRMTYMQVSVSSI